MSEPASAPLLEALAAGGVDAVPPDRFPDAGAEGYALADATGDARYRVVARLLFELLAWWEELQGVPDTIARDISRAITTHLPAVLSAATPAEGLAAASALAEDVYALMTPVEDWIARGLVKRFDPSDPNPGS